MKLNRKQFRILEIFAQSDEPLSQRGLETRTGYSLGTINKIMKSFVADGLIENGAITPLGLEALEPYRAKRVILLAAGFGSRLVPITLNTPKPLVRVNGERIIDNLLDACLEVGIEEIYVVRGYLSEQFDQLLYKYPMIKFIENPLYNETNNISSAICARHLFANAYVCEADILIRNPSLITKYHFSSEVLGIWRERSDDWCFKTSVDNIIISQQVGGMNCYQEIGITYLSGEDGGRYGDHLQAFYEKPGGRERFWDVALYTDYINEYKIAVKECVESDIVEIDTFSELKALDKAYDV